jgi:metabolite-proton symporter
MTTAVVAEPPQLDEQTRQRHLRRAVVASTIGTTIEWYDFFLYGSAAALVFPKLFFPSSDPFVGQILSFSTFFVGFVARPLGAALFGHFGDRVGRKALLVITMMTMGIATMAVGLVPSYASIGSWSALLLTLFRAMQGIAVGGEWSGSVLIASEWAPKNRRGFFTSWAQAGAPLGMMVANLALSGMGGLMSDEQFVAWGWRVPFLASVVLIVVGLYIRIGVLESPVFAALKSRGKVVKAPVVEVLRHNWREVALTTLVRTGQLAPYYIFTTYILTYGTVVLGLSRTMLLNLLSVRSITSILMIPLAGYVSDRFGRKRVVAAGLIGTGLWGFVYFELLSTGTATMIFLAMLIDAWMQDLQYGPQAALISEAFPASRRYTGSGLGYHLAAITAGGPAPVIATYLYSEYQTATAIAAFGFATTIISLVALYLLSDRASEDHS